MLDTDTVLSAYHTDLTRLPELFGETGVHVQDVSSPSTSPSCEAMPVCPGVVVVSGDSVTISLCIENLTLL